MSKVLALLAVEHCLLARIAYVSTAILAFRTLPRGEVGTGLIINVQDGVNNMRW